MDKKKKIIAITASIAVLVAVVSASLGGVGWLQSSALNVQGKIQSANESLSSANTALVALQKEKQSFEGAINTTNETLQKVRMTCLGYRSSLERIAKKVQEAENILKPLQTSYDAKVASRNALQVKFDDNKKTIDNNTKVVIPGIQKEQKKYKSTSAEYKKLTTDITTTKNQNTALTKENTDAKTGLQKQINALVAEIKVLEKIGSPLKVAQANVQSAKSSRPSKDETSACTTYDTAQAEKTGLSEQLSRIDLQMAQVESNIQALQAQLSDLGAELSEAQNQEAQEQAQKQAEDADRMREMARIIEEAQKQQAITNAAREKALQECLVEARTTIENDFEPGEGSRDLSVEEKEAECQNTYGPIDTTSTTEGTDGSTTGTTTSGTSGEGTTSGSTDGGTAGGDGATAGTLGTSGTTWGTDGDTTGGTGSEIAICGNWITEPPEVCDDWNTEDGDFCKANCLDWNHNIKGSCVEGLVRYTVPCGGGAQATVQEQTYDDCSFKIEASGPNGVHSLIQSTAQILAGNWSEKLWAINAACGY